MFSGYTRKVTCSSAVGSTGSEHSAGTSENLRSLSILGARAAATPGWRKVVISGRGEGRVGEEAEGNLRQRGVEAFRRGGREEEEKRKEEREVEVHISPNRGGVG